MDFGSRGPARGTARYGSVAEGVGLARFRPGPVLRAAVTLALHS